eukprot:5107369-Amphidinium_carterae.1
MTLTCRAEAVERSLRLRRNECRTLGHGVHSASTAAAAVGGSHLKTKLHPRKFANVDGHTP